MLEKLLKTALHIHTWVSRDCSLSKEQFSTLYKKANFDCLVVTDHGEISGAQELAKEGKFKIVIGEEIETQDGDLIGLFLKEKIPSGLTVEQTITQIRQQQGLTYLPHPFDRLRQHTISREKIGAIIDQVDIIEIFNARNVFAADDRQAQDLFDRLVETTGPVGASLRRPIPVCGTDAHTKYEIGKTFMEIKDFFDPASFLQSLRDGQMVLAYSPKFVHLITKWKKLLAR